MLTLLLVSLAGANMLRKEETSPIHLALDKDHKGLMMVQESKAPFTATDPCEKASCGDLKCPATFIPTEVPGHCCPYCVNPEIGFEAPVEGATGKYGGKKSVECPNVWCFPLMCAGGDEPKFTAGNCCQTCP